MEITKGPVPTTDCRFADDGPKGSLETAGVDVVVGAGFAEGVVGNFDVGSRDAGRGRMLVLAEPLALLLVPSIPTVLTMLA